MLFDQRGPTPVRRRGCVAGAVIVDALDRGLRRHVLRPRVRNLVGRLLQAWQRPPSPSRSLLRARDVSVSALFPSVSRVLQHARSQATTWRISG